jgi:hypothetical protein
VKGRSGSGAWILQRQMTAAPAAIADIGGRPRHYALWLAELGYAEEHRALVPLHVESGHELAARDSG